MIRRTAFGTTPEGEPVDCYTLGGGDGLQARVLTWGGTLVSLEVPVTGGCRRDVVLGFGTLAPYLGPHPYFGGIVGRYANRIAGGRFSLDGSTFQLPCNDGANHLHGGMRGFDRRLWQALPGKQGQADQLTLHYLSRDGEEGYPGDLHAEVIYTLTAENELRIDYHAQTDRPTVVNLTHHVYFNLAGHGDILGHRLRLVADRYLPVDAGLIPTGELAPVEGTEMDFRTPCEIGARIKADSEQLRRGSGYDHCWVLDGEAGVLAAELAAAGLRLSLYTSQPGLQFYSGNYLDGSLTGHGGEKYARHAGLCLEPQHFPDAPNRPGFPSTRLDAGGYYRETIVYRFDPE